MSVAPPFTKKPFASSILLWLRADQPRQEGKDYWKGPFRTFVNDEFVGAMASSNALKELRTQMFMPWRQKLWDTPNVAHDNPEDWRFHASVILGFTDASALRAFFASDAVSRLSSKLPSFVSAIHAYEMPEALT